MLGLLAKILGPSRAVSGYVALRRFGIPVALFIGFVAVFFLMVRVSHPDRMEHMAFVTAEVIALTPLTHMGFQDGQGRLAVMRFGGNGGAAVARPDEGGAGSGRGHLQGAGAAADPDAARAAANAGPSRAA